MKILTLLAVAVVSAGTVVAQTATPDTAAVAGAGKTVLGLDDCLRIALSESPTVKVADMDIVRVDYSRKETLGNILPTVAFGGTYSRMLAKQVAYMNLGDMPGMGGGDSDASQTPDAEQRSSSDKKDTGFKMGLDNSYQLGFSASLPLFAPQLWQALKLSDAQIAQSVEQARASRLNLVNQVKNAYYALMLAKDSRRVVQESYDMAKLTHDMYVKRQSVGDASEYDVLRTSVAMKNVEPEITQADIAISRARLQLFVLMGINPDDGAGIDFAGQLADYEDGMYEYVLSLGNDFSNNTSLRQNELQTNTLEQTVKMHKKAWYPTLSLSASYNWTSSSDGNPLRNFRWNPYSMVGITLNVSLFQGFQRYYRIRQAEVQVDMARMQHDDLVNSVNMQVKLARDNIRLNVKQIESCNESVGQAQKAYDIMHQTFDIGAASYLDLRDSELALTRSRLAYFQAVYNYLIAGAELELLLGNAVDASTVPVPDRSKFK